MRLKLNFEAENWLNPCRRCCYYGVITLLLQAAVRQIADQTTTRPVGRFGNFRMFRVCVKTPWTDQLGYFRKTFLEEPIKEIVNLQPWMTSRLSTNALVTGTLLSIAEKIILRKLFLSSLIVKKQLNVTQDLIYVWLCFFDQFPSINCSCMSDICSSSDRINSGHWRSGFTNTRTIISAQICLSSFSSSMRFQRSNIAEIVFSKFRL